MTRSIINKVNNIFNYYIKYGTSNYNNEISILEHSIQSSIIAEKYKLNNNLIISSFLHDIGQLVGMEQYSVYMKNFKDYDRENYREHDGEYDREYDRDRKEYELKNYGIRYHEKIGEQYLEELGFPKSITEPIGLHVMAKRYLLSINKNYYNVLSNNSKISLQHQGITMTDEEIKYFLNNKYYKESILLRLCDDNARFISLDNINYDKYYDMIYNYLSNINKK